MSTAAPPVTSSAASLELTLSSDGPAEEATRCDERTKQRLRSRLETLADPGAIDKHRLVNVVAGELAGRLWDEHSKGRYCGMLWDWTLAN